MQLRAALPLLTLFQSLVRRSGIRENSAARRSPEFSRIQLRSSLAVLSLCLSALHFAPAQQPAASPPPPPAPQPRPSHNSGARLAHVETIRKSLGLTPAYDNLPGIGRLKIAVLDYGFDGLERGASRYLPESTVVVEHYDPAFVRRFRLGDPDYRKSFAPLNGHGRSLAQIVWAVAGSHPGGPQFYLLNANGPTMLRRAVRYAIEAKVDIILFAGTFEGGGNGDGRGPINRIVAEALAADILWINAAGNYGGHVYNGPVEILPSGYLHLGNGPDNSGLRVRNRLDENTITITLTWNDYREQEDAGTTKDLDLYVENWQGWVLGSSEQRQVAANSPPVPEPNARPGPAPRPESRNPRERIVLTDLAADPDNDYLIRIKAKGGTFTPDDRIRVLITSSRETYFDPATGQPADAIDFRDATRTGELYPPADNPLVITVGDPSPASARGPTADHRRKPDIILEDSTAAFTNGDVTSGASNAAAYFTGVAALLKAAEPGLKTRHLLWFAHNDPATRASLSHSTDAASPPAAASILPRPRPRLARAAAGSPLASSLPRQPTPLLSRSGNTAFYYSPRSRPASSTAWPPASPWPEAGRSEDLPPPREVGAPTPPPSFVWRTPTREHLAVVVHGESSRR
jgi:hypothetical protein